MTQGAGGRLSPCSIGLGVVIQRLSGPCRSRKPCTSPESRVPRATCDPTEMGASGQALQAARSRTGSLAGQMPEPFPVNHRAPKFAEPSGPDPKQYSFANRDMPWRIREGRLLSLLRVRKTVGFGEPLPTGVGNFACRVVDRRVARPNDASPPPCATCGHPAHSRFASVRVGAQGETGGFGSVPEANLLSNSLASRRDRRSG